MSLNRLAPEWERQDAIIIVWPHPYSDWNNNLNSIEDTYLKLSSYISRKQRLVIIAYDQAHSTHILECIDSNQINTDNIVIVIIPTNDTWVRDFGPICVSSDSILTFYDFKFDAWGQKYNHDLDNVFNQKLFKKLNLSSNCIQINQVLETGNIEINGKGELFTSKSCYKRNSNTVPVNFSDMENNFLNWFGANKTYWIDTKPLIGDDTDGHIDNLIRFCSDDVVVYASKSHKHDANSDSLNDLYRQLQAIKLHDRTNLETVPIPLPDPITKEDVQLPASYANFLITNHHVFVPVFNDIRDQNALKTLDELFPSREVIDIDSTTLIKQFGGIHCMTMQIPEGFLA